MAQKVLVVTEINHSTEDQLADKLEALGEGWKIVSAATTSEVFGIVPNSGLPPLHHVIYTTTVVVESL